MYGQPDVIDSLKITFRFVSQLSVAVTFAAAGIAEHSTVMSLGTLTNVGAVVSSTVII